MAKSSTERARMLRKKRKLLGYKPYTVWIDDKEKAVIKPLIEEKIKELREKDSKD
jgi:hypothetical protein